MTVVDGQNYVIHLRSEILRVQEVNNTKTFDEYLLPVKPREKRN